MNNFFSKINIVSFAKGAFDRDPEKIDPSPKKDWAIILLSFLILSAFFVVFYYFMFLPKEVILNTNTVNGNGASIENISKSKLEKTLAPWKEREKQFNEYFDNRPVFDFLR